MEALELALEVYVIGPGVGECIVLKLPTTPPKWGVVDCGVGDRAARFLQSRGVTELEFIALTHPHHDHYRGMSKLFTDYKVHTFWLFDAMSPSDLMTIIELTGAGEADESKELAQIFRLQKDRKIDRQTMAAATDLYSSSPSPGTDLRIRSISPSGTAKVTYQDALAKFFKEGRFLGANAARLNHNLVSSALLIEFGQARVILGSDVERDGWAFVLQKHHHASLRSDLVKVSHHGSSNGYCDHLWQTFSPEKGAIAVLTPYTPKNLPSGEAVKHIKAHAKNLYSTARLDNRFPQTAKIDVGSHLTLEEQEVLSAEFFQLQPLNRTDKDSPTCIASFSLSSSRLTETKLGAQAIEL